MEKDVTKLEVFPTRVLNKIRRDPSHVIFEIREPTESCLRGRPNFKISIVSSPIVFFLLNNIL